MKHCLRSTSTSSTCLRTSVGYASSARSDTRFRRESLEACRATIEETRARANFEVVEILHEWEERDRARWGASGTAGKASSNFLMMCSSRRSS
jgi:hypothetical protein